MTKTTPQFREVPPDHPFLQCGASTPRDAVQQRYWALIRKIPLHTMHPDSLLRVLEQRRRLEHLWCQQQIDEIRGDRNLCAAVARPVLGTTMRALEELRDAANCGDRQADRILNVVDEMTLSAPQEQQRYLGPAVTIRVLVQAVLRRLPQAPRQPKRHFSRLRLRRSADETGSKRPPRKSE